jgi:hypothetical protein
MINGFFLIVYHLQKNPRKKLLKSVGLNNKSIVIVMFETLTTLFIVITAWVFFRANNMSEAFLYINGMLSKSLFTIPAIIPIRILVSCCVFFIIEWFGRKNQYALALMGINWGRPLRWIAYYALAISVFFLAGEEQQFIYFQF